MTASPCPGMVPLGGRGAGGLLGGFQAQPCEPFLLLGGEQDPVSLLSLEPCVQVVAVDHDAGPALIKDAGAVGVDPRTGVDGCGLYVCVEAEAPGFPWRRQSGVRGRIGPCQGVE